ncbi:MAG: hypothetical protein R8P61_13010 [Bacteroidia bacterium]|nr:hypothetical protein [Bacteroidia bacterium]
MRYLITSIVLLLIFPFSTFSQVKKKSLQITPFTVAGMVDDGVAERVSQYTYSGAIASKRVEVLGENSPGFSAGMATTDYVMEGSILGVEVKENSKTNEETGEVSFTYEAYINVSLKITEPKTGQIIASKQMRIGNDVLAGGGVGSFVRNAKTPEEAMENAMKILGNKTKKFIQKHFKLEAELVEITEHKGSQAKLVLVSGGAMAGFKKNQKLSVSIRMPKTLSNGTTLMRTQQIGEIKIIKVEDENFSIAQVLKGGQQIANAIEAGQVMICVTVK